jgi:hypothetical protein
MTARFARVVPPSSSSPPANESIDACTSAAKFVGTYHEGVSKGLPGRTTLLSLLLWPLPLQLEAKMATKTMATKARVEARTVRYTSDTIRFDIRPLVIQERGIALELVLENVKDVEPSPRSPFAEKETLETQPLRVVGVTYDG